jgi:hypothetical protein
MNKEASKADQLKAKGNQFFKDGEYQTAIRYYTQAIVNAQIIKFRKRILQIQYITQTGPNVGNC